MTSPVDPMCLECRHYNHDLTCTAYPDGIPMEILHSQVDHREPYEGDNGIQFEAIDDEGAQRVRLLWLDLNANRPNRKGSDPFA